MLLKIGYMFEFMEFLRKTVPFSCIYRLSTFQWTWEIIKELQSRLNETTGAELVSKVNF